MSRYLVKHYWWISSKQLRTWIEQRADWPESEWEVPLPSALSCPWVRTKLFFLVLSYLLTLQIPGPDHLHHCKDQLLITHLWMCAHRHIIGSVSLENLSLSHAWYTLSLAPPHCLSQNLLPAFLIPSLPCLTELWVCSTWSSCWLGCVQHLVEGTGSKQGRQLCKDWPTHGTACWNLEAARGQPNRGGEFCRVESHREEHGRGGAQWWVDQKWLSWC